MKKQGQLLKLSCSILFGLFTFIYVYCYQCDLISYAQMVLSEGKTHFDRTIGAFLITLALYLIYLFVYGLLRPHDRYLSLACFPSLLILTFITDVPENIADSFSIGAWIWGGSLILLLYVTLLYLLKQWSVRWQSDAGSLFHDLWVNMLILGAMFFLVCNVGNSNKQFHQQLRMEQLAIDGDYDELLDEMAEVKKPNERLTQLAAFALSQESQLGEHFFEYPVSRGSKSISPDEPSSTTYFIPREVLSMAYQVPLWKNDHELTGMLMDGRLKDFARKVKKCYADSVMPKHYREALAIFRQSKEAELLEQQEQAALKEELEKAKKERRSGRGKKVSKKSKSIHPEDSLMSKEYDLYQLLLHTSSDKRVVYNLSRKYYPQTYWHYYHFILHP